MKKLPKKIPNGYTLWEVFSGEDWKDLKDKYKSQKYFITEDEIATGQKFINVYKKL